MTAALNPHRLLHFDTRNEMVLALVQPGSDIAEVGVFRGDFSDQLLRTSPAHLHLIDPWEGQIASGNADGADYQVHVANRLYDQVCMRFSGEPRVLIHRKSSQEALPLFADRSLDAIYIDGGHSYEAVKQDLNLALKKVRSGGWIMGHDYAVNPAKSSAVYAFGIDRAVREFCETNGLYISALAHDGYVSFAIQISERPKVLVYYAIGHDPNYASMMDLSIASLRQMSSVVVDILIISDEKMRDFVRTRNISWMNVPSTCSASDSSMNKLRIFEYGRIERYETVIYLDADTIVHTDLSSFFVEPLLDDILVVYAEVGFDGFLQYPWSLSNKLFTNEQIAQCNKNNIRPFNTGFFMFKPSTIMRNHFEALRGIVTTYDGDHFYEQSFLNYYFPLHAKLDQERINNSNYCLLQVPSGIPPKVPGRIVHFCGAGFPSQHKLQTMEYYLDRYLTLQSGLSPWSIPVLAPGLSLVIESEEIWIKSDKDRQRANPIAAAILQRCAPDKPLSRIISELESELDGELMEMSAGITEFLTDLNRRGIVELLY